MLYFVYLKSWSSEFVTAGIKSYIVIELPEHLASAAE